ncbi:hypothetical protein DPX16_12665 [Anabarilius grahami]|uniref:Uncharacterized protein n=1 Tax=Anabarilius grahami TaxID=495550 RepID=A0A3N0YKI8_ANAGA|nr:hypothetical protein DPX16_12665 [Anabarilius grahami]
MLRAHLSFFQGPAPAVRSWGSRMDLADERETGPALSPDLSPDLCVSLRTPVLLQLTRGMTILFSSLLPLSVPHGEGPSATQPQPGPSKTEVQKQSVASRAPPCKDWGPSRRLAQPPRQDLRTILQKKKSS